MKILLVAYANVRGWYAATLMERGHKVTIYGGGALHAHAIKSDLENDGCLLLGSDKDMLEIADYFEEMGKPVWRQLADIPKSKPASSSAPK
jgi:hypothetical protein